MPEKELFLILCVECYESQYLELHALLERRDKEFLHYHYLLYLELGVLERSAYSFPLCCFR